MEGFRPGGVHATATSTLPEGAVFAVGPSDLSFQTVAANVLSRAGAGAGTGTGAGPGADAGAVSYSLDEFARGMHQVWIAHRGGAVDTDFTDATFHATLLAAGTCGFAKHSSSITR
jgi:hypothetical protein